MVGTLARLVVVTLVTATGVLLPVARPALAAAGCRPGHGVTVVVDFHQLHHGDVRTCLPDGADRDAARLLRAAGLRLTDVQRQPGFVCRVDGLPADDPCVNTPPADAYWSLWWSDGTSKEWRYSTVMASSLEVPDGGFVALVWDQAAGELRPSVAPDRAATSARQPVASRDGAQADAADDGDDGLPWWVAPVVLAVVFGTAAGVAAERRRQRSGGR